MKVNATIVHRTQFNAKIQKPQLHVFLTTSWIVLNALHNVLTEPMEIHHQKPVRSVQKDVQHVMVRQMLAASPAQLLI